MSPPNHCKEGERKKLRKIIPYINPSESGIFVDSPTHLGSHCNPLGKVGIKEIQKQMACSLYIRKNRRTYKYTPWNISLTSSFFGKVQVLWTNPSEWIGKQKINRQIDKWEKYISLQNIFLSRNSGCIGILVMPSQWPLLQLSNVRWQSTLCHFIYSFSIRS